VNPQEWLASVVVEEIPEDQEAPLPFVRATRAFDSVMRLVNKVRRGEPMQELCAEIVREVTQLAVKSGPSGLPRQRAVTVPGKFITLANKYGDMVRFLSLDQQFTQAADACNILADYIEAERPWVEIRDQTKETIVWLLLMLASLERKREAPPMSNKPDETKK